ncbi:MAG: nucleotidyl transferase AbiEii/AbiGii toxin family protein [Propionibacteriaceae bacterium]|nr:nucleotidyl transferase AbiEii/AbiGii toxin family protein [Propionibacteriaceae bacterium]
MSDSPDLSSRLRTLIPKGKQPNSATVLNNWITKAERDLGVEGGGRLGWLIASTIVTAALQRAVAADGQSRFLLKGGTMLQHRLAMPTRATKDLDGLVLGDIDAFLADLDATLSQPWGPLGFRRGEIEVIDTPARLVKPRRFQVTLTLRGVTWRRVQVELSPDEGSAGEAGEAFPAPELAGFGLPGPDVLVGLAMRYQIAQKLHASSDPHDPPHSVNDRARDVVDLLLLKTLVEDEGSPTRAEIRDAAVDIFTARATEAQALGRTPRAWPPQLTSHPHWVDDYARAAESADLHVELDDAITTLNTWIDRIDKA